METLSRRTFLTVSAAVAGGSRALAAERTPIIDTHLHCFAGNDPKFPYHKDAPYTPEEATPELLLRCMQGAGVDFAVVVHPEPYQDDHRYVEHCLAVGKGKLKGTCLFFAGREDSPQRMAALAKKMPLVAARIHAYNPDRLPPFGEPSLREFWKAAGDAGLSLQLHFEPRWAEGFEALIREFKDIRVIVDHLGRPFQGSRKEYERVVGWSKYPNVLVKISALPKKTEYPYRDVQVEIKQLTAAYGAQRLMYGGGFGPGATPTSYRAERERIASFLAHLTDADRNEILGGAAAKLMGFTM